MNQILDTIQLFKTGSVLPGSDTPATASIFTSGSIPNLFYKNTSGNIYNLTSTSSYYNILEFTSSATWVRPVNVKYIRVLAVSAGGSGGSGGFGITSGTVTGGCGAAGGGTIIEFFSSASLPPGRYNITIGVGGSPPSTRTTPGGGGNGLNGTQTVFATGSTIILAPLAGGGGSNGNTSPVVENGGSSNLGTVTPNTRWPNYRYGIFGASVSAFSGIVQTTVDALNMFSTHQYWMGAGGSGGHMSSSGVFEVRHRATSGSNIFYPNLINTNTPGAWGTGADAQTVADVLPAIILTQITGSTPGYTPKIYMTGGGGGGGSGDFAGTLRGGNGGDGGIGCGGGGGGATMGIRNGAGGRGGRGYLVIIEYY